MFGSPSAPPPAFRYRGTCLDLGTQPTVSGWWYVPYNAAGFPTYWGGLDAALLTRRVSYGRVDDELSICNGYDNVTRKLHRAWRLNAGTWTVGSWQANEMTYTSLSSSGWNTTIGAGFFLYARNIANEVHIHGYIEATATATATIATIASVFRPAGNSLIGKAYMPAAYYRSALAEWQSAQLSVDSAGALIIDNYPGFAIVTGDQIMVNAKYPRIPW